MAIQYLDKHRPLGKHQYAVIDRMKVPVLPEHWPCTELISPVLAPQAHIYPWLIPLHQFSPEEWRAFMATQVQQTIPHECTLLLSSSLTVEEIRSALIGALHFKDKQQRGYILRYYDPRVLFHLHWMLKPAQLFNQLSARGIPFWTFWHDGNWSTLEFTEDTEPPCRDNMVFPLEQLRRIGQINLVLKSVTSTGDIDGGQQTSCKINALLEQAEMCGLSVQEDCIAFASHGLVQPEGFWKAPKMATFLEQVRHFPGCYRDETHLWDDNHWQEMTSEDSRRHKIELF